MEKIRLGKKASAILLGEVFKGTYDPKGPIVGQFERAGPAKVDSVNVAGNSGFFHVEGEVSELQRDLVAN